MTEFQMKIKSILKGDFEFTEREKSLIKQLWLTDEELQQQQAATYYARQKSREDQDYLFKEWRKVTNCLNVTLQKVKKDGKPRTETIKNYLKKLEGIVANGYDPNGIRRSQIDWEASFKKGEIVRYESNEE